VMPRARPDLLDRIWLGGSGHAAYRRVAQQGAGWLPSYVSPSQFAAGKAEIERLSSSVRRPSVQLRFGALLPIAFGLAKAIVEELRAYVSLGATRILLFPVTEADLQLRRIREDIVLPLESSET